MLLKDICTVDVVCCGREATVMEAALLLRGQHTGDVVVVDDPAGQRLPAGLITDRDIVVKVLAAGRDPQRVTVGQLMGTPLVSASEDEDTSQAIARMRAHGVRRLPVTGQGGQLVGIVTLDDLLRLLAADLGGLLAIVSKEQDRERRIAR